MFFITVMLINLKHLIQPSYLLARYNAPLSRTFLYAWLIAGAAFFVGGIIVRILLTWRRAASPVWARWFRRVATMLSTSGFVALVILFFRYERVPIFSARVLIVGWILCTLAWTIYLAYIAVRRLPADLSAWEDKQRIKRYLPKKT